MQKPVEAIGRGAAAVPVTEAWHDFPGAAGKNYIDVAARGIMPRTTRDALNVHLDELAAGEVNKSAYFAMIERVRASFARLINAGTEEIAFTKNTSEGLNIIATALDWRAGDNLILCPGVEHPANFFPWRKLREAGVELRAVAARDGIVPVEEIARRIDGRTRVVTVATVNFVPGLRTEVASLGRVCRERNVLLAVDAAQSIGVIATDVQAMGIDALSCSTQKGMLALYGMGFLYVRRDWAERMKPVYLSRFGIELGGASEADFEDAYTLAPGARRFDVGNFNFTASVAAGASIEYLSRYTPQAIEEYVLGLAGDLRRGLDALGLHVCGGLAGPHLAHIVTVGRLVPGGHDLANDRQLQGLYEYLVAQGVRLSIRRGALRFSFHLYNRPDDVARVLNLAATFLRKA